MDGKSLIDKIASVFSDEKKRLKCLVLLGATGVLLIALSGMMPRLTHAPENDKSNGSELYDYCEKTELRLKEILSHIEGVGEAHVMVTPESGVEYRYAADEKQSGDSIFTYSAGADAPSKVQEKEDREQSYILVGSSSDKKPLVITEISPKVKGVVVVCSGAKSPITRQRVTDAVVTALGISSLQVCVIQSE